MFRQYILITLIAIIAVSLPVKKESNSHPDCVSPPRYNRTVCGCMEQSQVPDNVVYLCCPDRYGCLHHRDEEACPDIEIELDGSSEPIDCESP